MLESPKEVAGQEKKPWKQAVQTLLWKSNL